MKVKISELQNVIPNLNILATTKLNFKTSYDVAKRIRMINAELELFEKFRIEKLKELSGNVIENNQYILGDNKEKFEIEIKELMNNEVDIDLIPLKKEDFANIQIEPVHLMNSLFLFADEAKIDSKSEHKE